MRCPIRSDGMLGEMRECDHECAWLVWTDFGGARCSMSVLAMVGWWDARDHIDRLHSNCEKMTRREDGEG